MTRYIAIAVCAVLLFTLLTGCVEVVFEKVIDVEYVAAYDAMETVYEYKYDWLHGEFKYLPVYKTVHHDAVYNVQYEIIYSDGTTTTRWKEVTKDEYDKALSSIKKGGAE